MTIFARAAAPVVLRGMMLVSGAGIATITGHEGLSYIGYLDSVGVPTVCYGHTRTAQVGTVFSQERCDELLQEDLAEFAATVNKNIKVDLSQQQFDSLVSFCYNVGSYACRTSTMFRLINDGDYLGGAAQFDRWYRAGGRDCRVRANNCYGVWTRRQAEKQLFLAGTSIASNSAKFPIAATGD